MSVDSNMEDIIKKMQELSLKNIFRKEEWECFFEGEEMHSVIINPRFLRALGDSVYLKHIGADLHDYLNGQLDIIAGYLKDYGVDYEGSEETEALDYARSKVKSAYQPKQTNDDSNARRVLWIILAVVGIGFPSFSRYMIVKDNQKREQERKAFQEQLIEHEAEMREQQQEMIQNMLDGNSDFSEGVRQHMQEQLEEGTITQEEYDSLMQQFGFDRNDPGDEVTEE